MVLDSLKTLHLLYAALASDRWTPEKRKGFHKSRLRRLLFHAYRHVPLYTRLYQSAGFKPEDFRSLDDLESIPVLSKASLKNARPADKIVRGMDVDRCRVVNTSGSTGKPLQVFLGPGEKRWQRAVAWRILFEHGFKWHFKTLELRMTLGENFFVQKWGVAPKDWLSILDPPEVWVHQLVRKKYDVCMAGAGTLQTLSEKIMDLGADINRPRLVISDSETLTPEMRAMIRGALGCDPIDVYGLVEVSNFAWQCEKREGFHISADSHLVEVAAQAGKTGHIIVTGLGMWTMPIIRYDTEDLGERAPEACPCGRTLPVLKRIYGRAADAVVLPEGGRLLWPFFHEILGRYHELHQWQVIQTDPKHIRVQLVFPGKNQRMIKRIESDLRGALPGTLQYCLEQIDPIPAKPGEKTRMVISRIDSSEKQDSVNPSHA